VDYRKFLGRREELVLPYLGGPRVDAPNRRLSVVGEIAPGWWRFDIEGRRATPKEKVQGGDLSSLPRVRGHLLHDRLVREGAVAEQVSLMPEEEPPMFAPCHARRWHSGDLLFEELPFEGDAEAAVRLAFEEGRGLAGIKGVSATLRTAYGYAIAEAASQRIAIPAAPAELRKHVAAIAEGGAVEAEAVLRRLDGERRAYLRELEANRQQHEAWLAHQQIEEERAHRRDRAARDEAQGLDRALNALDATGAQPVSVRRLGDGNLEVTFRFMGERFLCVVEGATLQVLDAGICLGHPGNDRVLTLDSLPGVIREAIEDGVLVITRHA
jgi:hypothetical protein